MRRIFSHVVEDPRAQSFPVRKLTVVFNAYQTSMAFSAQKFERFVTALERLSDYLALQNYVNIDDDQILFGTAVCDTFFLRIAFFRSRIFVVNLADMSPDQLEIDFTANLLVSGVGFDAKVVYVNDSTQISSVLDWIDETPSFFHSEGKDNHKSEISLLGGHIERLIALFGFLDLHCHALTVNSDSQIASVSLGHRLQPDYFLRLDEASRSWLVAAARLKERPSDWLPSRLAPLADGLHSVSEGDAISGCDFGMHSRSVLMAALTGCLAAARLKERPSDWLPSRLAPLAHGLHSVPQGDGLLRSLKPS